MQYKEVNIDFLINKITSKDKLFNGDYTIDPYRNCGFGCIYCDSSYEKVVYIKKNSIEILKKEIKKINKGKIIIGSVHDPYQEIEKERKLARQILKILYKEGFSCHILTKSDLILRDLDIIKKFKDCNVTISISSIKKRNSDIFEKNVISPKKRFGLIRKLSEEGIKSGISVIPFIPYITDKEIRDIFIKAKENKASYILYKYLELKGDQKNIFLNHIKNTYPNLINKYRKLYKDSYKPNDKYLVKIDSLINNISKDFIIKNKI